MLIEYCYFLQFGAQFFQILYQMIDIVRDWLVCFRRKDVLLSCGCLWCPVDLLTNGTVRMFCRYYLLFLFQILPLR